ncbi:pregnancy zone protein [Trichonephila inaurata madagascariensis]|uniref:Pregnancy zone protein n=1 Tax=Trichonephila inaurata madagascariensis TaxID=2747483 RepID=A0A8X6WWK4_9ARAC|nr:pregnancy zone protein [Trichonephila inaurata madagascariensis]
MMEYTIPAACTWTALPTMEDDVEPSEVTSELPEFLEQSIAIDPDVSTEHFFNASLFEEFLPNTTETSTQKSFSEETNPISTESTIGSIDLAISTTSEELKGSASTVQNDVTDIVIKDSTEISTITEQVELADDANLPHPEKNMTHLVNFTNVDHDLDFPDGIEGNIPVSVPYFATTTPFVNYSEIPKSTEETAPLNCPICETQFPENFTDIYCNSAFALRVIVRQIKTKAVKILQEISYFLPQPRGMRKFAKLEYDSQCSCPQLQKEQESLLVQRDVSKRQIPTQDSQLCVSSQTNTDMPV